jgi:hypothetical protein
MERKVEEISMRDKSAMSPDGRADALQLANVAIGICAFGFRNPP